MKRLIPLLLVGLTAVASAADRYTDGNAAAAQGDHSAAVSAFNASIAESGWSVNVLLGLSSSHAAAGDVGRAVLALERAKVLAPRDAAVDEALATVREQAGVSTPQPSRIDHMLAVWPSDVWTYLSLAALALACLGATALVWSRRRAGGLVGVAGVAAAVLSAWAALRVAPDPDVAIVVDAEPARIAPFAAAETAFSARPGERVHVEQRRDEFVYVRVDAERSGWLPAASVEKVITADRRTPAT